MKISHGLMLAAMLGVFCVSSGVSPRPSETPLFEQLADRTIRGTLFQNRTAVRGDYSGWYLQRAGGHVPLDVSSVADAARANMSQRVALRGEFVTGSTGPRGITFRLFRVTSVIPLP